MKAKIGKMYKRINSTLQEFEGEEVDVVLKEHTSKDAPVFKLTGMPLPEINYMMWADRYYWIEDIKTITNNMYEIYCKLDTLATFKDSILNSGGYVNFYSSLDDDYTHNYAIDDPRLSPTVSKGVHNLNLNVSDLLNFSTSGCILLTVVAATDLTSNSVVTYALPNLATFNNLMQAFGSTIKANFDGVNDVAEVIKNAMVGFLGGGSWSDYIKSCIWLPIARDDIPGILDTSVVTIGGYQINMNTKYFSSPANLGHIDGSISLSSFSTWLNKFEFLKTSKYSVINLHHPCGVSPIHISNPQLDKLYYLVAFNFLNGDYYVKIASRPIDSDLGESPYGNSDLLCQAEGNVAIDFMNIIAGGSTVGGSILKATGNSLMAIAGGAASSAIVKSDGSTTTSKMTSITSELDGNSTHMNSESITTSKQTDTTGIKLDFMNTGFSPSYVGGNVNSALGLYHNGYSEFNKQFYVTCETIFPALMSTMTKYDDFCKKYGYPYFQYINKFADKSYISATGVSIEPDGDIIPNSTDISNLNTLINSGIYIE